MNLWGQVITLRGQILVSRTDDATLCALCCVLCVVCCGCAMCWCWCVKLTLLLSTHPPLSLRVYVQNALRVHIQNVPVCTSTTPASVTTCGRGAGTHGDVMNVHTWVFSVPHHTTRTHHDHNNNHHHNNTGTDRDRQTERDREEDRERDVMQNVLRVRQISTNRRVSELTRSR